MCEIEQSLAREAAQSQLAAARKELHLLAAECSKAFVATGMEQNEHPQVKKALELCSSYTSRGQKPSHKDTTSSAIASLWKQSEENEEMSTDRKKLATSILGKHLVDTLVEEDRQPPDVSAYCDSLFLSSPACIHFSSLACSPKV